MFNGRRFGFWGVVGIVFLVCIPGCASSGLQTSRVARAPVEVPGEISKPYWWIVGFRVDWPPEEEPRWYMDLLLAREVVEPVLQRYRQEILLWRFHRRAARDPGGHEFGFLFYAPSQTARRITEAIASDGTLKALESAGLILGVRSDDPDKPSRPGIQDTSDTHWSLPVQQSWPYYIMGVSEMWLDLIDRLSKEREDAGGEADRATLQGMEHGYRALNEAVEKIWHDEGGHAFLHHLNAIFGYEPVAFRGTGEMAF